MYDQHRNGQRVEELKLGFSYALDSLLDPSYSLNSPDLQNLRDTAVDASVQTVRTALIKCISPAQRLRCACVGRKMRTNPTEDGVTNAVDLLWEEMSRLIPPQVGEKAFVNSIDENRQFVHANDSKFDSSFDSAPDGLLVLPNKLKIHAHWKTAPEETVFLYEEIFERQVYTRGVAQLQSGDLVVDVGRYDCSCGVL